MRGIFLIALLCLTNSITAQQAVIKQAIISTTTNVIAPEEEDVQSLQNQQTPGGMNFRNMMDGETKFTTYLKDNLVKTVIKNEMGRSTILRDNDKKITTTIVEMMGNKMGFYITDEEQQEQMKKRDSMMKSRRSKDSSASATQPATIPTEISITTETKKIAGYNCTKAYLINTRLLGIKDSTIVWFTPDIKIQNLQSTGGMAAFGGMMGNMGVNLNGLEKIDGFVMGYAANMRNRRRMEVEVTKIDLKKEIEEKEFILPKDIEIKPMKEMQNMFGGQGGQFRRGN